MILSEVRTYIAEHKRATLMDMCYRFDADPDALRGMLAILQRKGKIRMVADTSTCSPGCCKCDAKIKEIYEWITPDP